MQYVERRSRSSASIGEQTSTAWFQSYLRTNARKYMTSPTSCWPIWGDNHMAMFSSTRLSINTVIDRLRARGWTEYHPFIGVENGVAGFGHTALYMLEPSGWQIEFHGDWQNPPINDTDEDIGNFNQYCASHC